MTFSTLAEHWLSEVIAVTWQFSVLATITWFLLRLLGTRLSPRARHLIWFVVLLRLLVPFGLDSPLGLVGSAPDSRGSSAAIAAAPLDTSPVSEPMPVSSIELTSHSALTPATITLAAWAAMVMLLVAAWFIRAHRSSERLRRSWEAVPASLQREIDILGAELKLKTRIPAKIVADDLVTGPGILGVLRPHLILPQTIVDSQPGEERTAVLVHELVHVVRRDHLLQPVIGMLQVLYFFHPVVWLVARWVRHEREIAVDDQVISTLGSDRRCSYADALLHFAQTRWVKALPSVGMGAPRSRVGRRLIRFLDDDYRPNRRSRRTALCLVTLCVLATLAVAAGTARDKETDGPEVNMTIEWRNAQLIRNGQPTWVELNGDFEVGKPVRDTLHIRSRLATLPHETLAHLANDEAAVAVTIDASGRPKEVEVVRSAHPEIDRILVEALSNTLFEPTRHYIEGPVPVQAVLRCQLASKEPSTNPDERLPLSDDDLKSALASTYVLAPGESLRLLPPPHGKERMELYRLDDPGQATAIPEGPELMVIELRDGVPRFSGGLFGDSTTVENILMLAGHYEARLFGDREVFNRTAQADLLIDQTASRQQLDNDLRQQMLQYFAIRLESVVEERPTIVLRGQFDEIRDAVGANDKPSIWLSLSESRDDGSGGGLVSSVRQFADLLERHVGLPVEIDNVAELTAPILVRLHRSTYRTERIGELFDAIQAQCSLELSLEKRDVQMLLVEDATKMKNEK